MKRILLEVCGPLFKMIQMWMIHGDAHDIYGDFFVVEDVEEENVWVRKYKLNVEQIPLFLTYDTAYRVFLAGKTINFIRKSCADIEWTVPDSLKNPKVRSWGDMLLNPGILNEWISKVSEATNKRLISLLFDKYHFLEHCKNINRYLLSAQGNFHQHLMDLMYNALSKPTESIYK